MISIIWIKQDGKVCGDTSKISKDEDGCVVLDDDFVGVITNTWGDQRYLNLKRTERMYYDPEEWLASLSEEDQETALFNLELWK